MNKQLALKIVGGLSNPSKMPCHSYSIPAQKCIAGMKLHKVANSICSKCYALKGMYGFPVVKAALEKRFASLFTPDWIPAMVFLVGKVEKSGFFRWHDSGDIQSVAHLNNIIEVVKLTPHIQHWLPTREWIGHDGKPSFVAQWVAANGAFPANLTVRLSALMLEAAPPTAVAARLGVLTSGVSKTGFNCPAPNQKNKCGDCRACWNKSVANVNYRQH
jgi:hypothetical protein